MFPVWGGRDVIAGPVKTGGLQKQQVNIDAVSTVRGDGVSNEKPLDWGLGRSLGLGHGRPSCCRFGGFTPFGTTILKPYLRKSMRTVSLFYQFANQKEKEATGNVTQDLP